MGVITENFKPYTTPGGSQQNVNDSVVVASANDMPAPNAFLSIVSGTTQINRITLPWPGFGGMIAYRPTGIFTGATGGTASGLLMPIGLAFTAVVGKIQYMMFDPTTNLWYPSYTS